MATANPSDSKEEIGLHVESRLVELRKEASLSFKDFQVISDYISPSRFRQTSDEKHRARRSSKIVNNSATMSSRVFASGMQVGVTSEARPWFKLNLPDRAMARLPRPKRWLYEVEQEMRTLFSGSNLYNVLPYTYRDLGDFSTAALMEMEDTLDRIRFYPFVMGSYYIGHSYRLAVDTLMRETKMTVKNIVSDFGYRNCPEMIRAQYDAKRYDQEFEVVHAIEPRHMRNPNLRDMKNSPYREVYKLKGKTNGELLEETGYREFPVFVPRWNVIGMDVWGSEGPGYIALSDVKGLQLEERRKLEAIDKLVNPPMVASDKLKNQRHSLLPGDTTYLADTNGVGFKPAYEINPRTAELQADIAQTEARIRRAYYEDLFLMLANDTRSNVTAEEIARRHEEKMLMLGPVLGRIHEELLDPVIDRTFSIMLELGLVPPPPPEMKQGAEIRVEYISVLAQAQQLIGLAPIERTLAFVGNMAGVYPEAIDKVDFDEAIEQHGIITGLPPGIIRGADVVNNIRKKREQQQQQMQNAAMASQMANQGAQTAKLLSETEVQGEAGLDRLLRNVGARA